MKQTCHICGLSQELTDEEQQMYDSLVARGEQPRLNEAGDIDAICPGCSPLADMSPVIEHCSTAASRDEIIFPELN